MHKFGFLLDEINRTLKAQKFPEEPAELYDAISYTFEWGGKRIRPVLVLMACEIFGTPYEKALNAALAVEVFHNFTLVHDDIMDKAPLRRGKESVYKKWNTNVAILAGDTMLAKAYEYLAQTEEKHLRRVLKIFTQTAIDVCEGQQYDMNFESAEKVSIRDYLNMIKLKTGMLLGASLRIGAVIGGAGEKDEIQLGKFGTNLGIAFQLKDDLLDVFGDEKKFGKKCGNDIVTNKKTFLYLKAFELAKGETRDRLLYHFINATIEEEIKIREVKKIYVKLKVREHTERVMQQYYQKALANLDAVKTDPKKKAEIYKLAEMLMVREY